MPGEARCSVLATRVPITDAWTAPQTHYENESVDLGRSIPLTTLFAYKEFSVNVCPPRLYVRARIGNITFNYVAKYPATWSRLTMLMLRSVHATRSRLALAFKTIRCSAEHRKYRLRPGHYGEISARENGLMTIVLLSLKLLDVYPMKCIIK